MRQRGGIHGVEVRREGCPGHGWDRVPMVRSIALAALAKESICKHYSIHLQEPAVEVVQLQAPKQ